MRMIDCERFRIDHETAYQDKGGVIPLKDALEIVLSGIDLKGGRQLQRLAERWIEVVGVDAAKHCAPGRLDGKCLFINVDNSAWLSEISRYGAAGIPGKISALGLGIKVDCVKFQIGAGGR